MAQNFASFALLDDNASWNIDRFFLNIWCLILQWPFGFALGFRKSLVNLEMI